MFLFTRRRRRNTSESASAVYLAFTTQPGTGGASPYTVNPKPVVAAKKSKGTTDTAKAGTVTIALVVLSGSPVLSGTTTKALVSGVADFSANGLTVTGAGTWYLVATLAGLTGATSVTGTTTASSTHAIALPAANGTAKMASPLAAITTATGLCFRFRVKGAALLPSASSHIDLIAISDDPVTVGKVVLYFDRDGSGNITPNFWDPTSGAAASSTFLASAITDPTAWYEVLWLRQSGGTNQRQFMVWKVGTTAPVVSSAQATATNALPTANGGVVSFGHPLNGIWSIWADTDWDFFAVYTAAPYDGYNSSLGVPALPAGTDTGILAGWLLEENTGTTSANLVGGGAALTLLNATWEAGS